MLTCDGQYADNHLSHDKLQNNKVVENPSHQSVSEREINALVNTEGHFCNKQHLCCMEHGGIPFKISTQT